MERALRRYIIRILAVHLAFLVVAVAVVAWAGQSLYQAAEAQAVSQAIDQARKPARQAADGVLRHFGRVFDTLTVVSPDSLVADEASAGDLWLSLREAASDVVFMRVDDGWARELRRFGNAPGPRVAERADRPVELDRLLDADTPVPDDVRRIAIQVAEQSLLGRSTAVLGPIRVGPQDDEAMMLATAVSAETAAVAIVPTAYLDRAFLSLSREPGRLELLLADPNERELLVGRSDVGWPAYLQSYVDRRLAGETMSPELIDGKADIGGAVFDGTIPAVAMARTVDSSGNRSLATVNLAVVALLNGESALGPLAAVSRTAVLWAAAVIAIMTAILVSSSAQLIRGRHRLENLRTEMVEQELRAARSIQLRWLPEDGIRHVADRDVDVAAENLPASHISGDFYNYFELPGGDAADCRPNRTRLALVVGDVTGHGMAAAFLMSTAQLLAEAALRRDPDPGHALGRVNAQLSRQAHGGQFVTLLLCVLDADANELCLAAAGHAGPLVCDEQGHWREIEVAGDLVAGVMEQVTYETTRVPLEDVRSMILYTDGAIEAQNLHGERFSLEKLCAALEEHFPAGPDDAKSAVTTGLRIVRDFAGGAEFEDDVTLLGVHLQSVEDERVDDDAAGKPHQPVAMVG
ncbi:MAG: PP2C family protein-serine/threonine phosphatase [Planctomycetota bacterium]